MRIDILSLFPEFFQGPLNESIVGQARKKGIISVNLVDIRAFADNKWNRVDDRPYGGGPGMVLMPGPVVRAIRHVREEGKKEGFASSRVVYMSPQGTPLTAAKGRELSAHRHLILLCGHYEGIDERALQLEVDEEVSIGDYVLTNGCLAACVVLDVAIRFVPGVIGHEAAANEDSFENGLLDWPHYTRPEEFEGLPVPKVLLGGNHQEIEAWRHGRAKEKTERVRPDLLS